MIVTLKYVLFLLRVDNRGEGDILALYTMVRLAFGRRSIAVLALAIAGAALFFGDAAITPAIFVLSAVEGAVLVLPALERFVVPVALGHPCCAVPGPAVGDRSGRRCLRACQGALVRRPRRTGGSGTSRKSRRSSRPSNPAWGASFLFEHSLVAFAVLGAVFLAVTGAEALYADLGHFGRKPIMAAWFALVFLALVLNYLGQGALVLSNPDAIGNPLFAMVPAEALP